MMTDEATYTYDVFISYRWVEPDQTWVIEQLEPALERAGLKAFVDVHDFVPGHDIIREMERAGMVARRAICVISPAYFEGDERMAEFEELMFRRQNPSGQKSRLIPFVIRPTKIPPRLSGLIPVDWTKPENREREWKRLLRTLEAKDEEAAPPSGLPEPGEPVPPPPPPPPEPPKPFPYSRLIILAAALLAAGLAIYFFYPRPPSAKDIDGTVYYLPEGADPRRVPVQNVIVFLSRQHDLKSDPTGPDGRFVIRGVPPNLQGTPLTARLGSTDFPPMNYRETGDYAVIPRQPEQPRDIRTINKPWTEVPGTADCALEEHQKFTHVKQYTLETNLPPAPGKKEALVTITLRGAGEAELVSPTVISPALGLGLYRNLTMGDQSRHIAHTWVFQLPQTGLNIKLGVCIGSNQSAAELSPDRLETAYELE